MKASGKAYREAELKKGRATRDRIWAWAYAVACESQCGARKGQPCQASPRNEIPEPWQPCTTRVLKAAAVLVGQRDLATGEFEDMRAEHAREVALLVKGAKGTERRRRELAEALENQKADHDAMVLALQGELEKMKATADGLEPRIAKVEAGQEREMRVTLELSRLRLAARVMLEAFAPEGGPTWEDGVELRAIDGLKRALRPGDGK